MSYGHSDAAENLETQLKPVLKAKGYRKKRRNWWRSEPISTRTVVIEKNRWDGKTFDVVGGVYYHAFGDISEPKYFQCHVQCNPQELADCQSTNVATVENELLRKLDAMTSLDGVARLFSEGPITSPYTSGDLTVSKEVQSYLEMTP